MAKTSLLPRGFKAEADRIASSYRSELGLRVHEPLSGFTLAEHLKVKVFTPLEFHLDAAELKNIAGAQNIDTGWSAVTLKTKSENKIIIHNHLHPPVRQQSNLMHELAHIICNHQDPEEHGSGLYGLMRPFNKQQEEEANYLGATLQITRDGLLWALKQGMSEADIGEYYTASPIMVKFRINSTGVKRQLRYYK